jgi:coproporphyrinogen III oxidase-like Fe-S oxidoreductase
MSRRASTSPLAGRLSRRNGRLGAELPGRVLNSIFFGGGTPSLMAPETVAGVIEAARAHLALCQ